MIFSRKSFNHEVTSRQAPKLSINERMSTMKIFNKGAVRLAVALTVLLCVTGCADTVSFTQAMGMDQVGFWYGLWHGMCFPFSWIGSLFADSISVYAIYNNGGWYDFGFFLGVGGLSASILNL